MLRSNASHSSSFDGWRRRDERAKEIYTLGSWRDRSHSIGSSNGSGERKQTSTLDSWRDRSWSTGSSSGSGDTGERKEILGNWRVRRLKTASREDLTEFYGHAMPAEYKLQILYRDLKVDTNRFITWLVESIYPCPEGLPCSEILPPYVSLAPKQAKDHPKYLVIVNNTTDLARQVKKVPLGILDLLERTIEERTEYSHWLSQKYTDNLARIENEKHLYYIEVLKQVKIIFAERTEPA